MPSLTDPPLPYTDLDVTQTADEMREIIDDEAHNLRLDTLDKRQFKADVLENI
jgi:hypothetical protein